MPICLIISIPSSHQGLLSIGLRVRFNLPALLHTFPSEDLAGFASTIKPDSPRAVRGHSLSGKYWLPSVSVAVLCLQGF